MYTVLLRIPPKITTLDSAVIETTFNLSPAHFFHGQLEDIQSSSNAPFSMELFAKDNCVYLYLTGEKSTVDRICTSIYGYLGDMEAVASADPTGIYPENSIIAGLDLGLELPDIYPLQTYKDFAWDSLTPIVTALGRIPDGDTALIQVIARPMPFKTGVQVERKFRRLLETGLRHFRPSMWLRNHDYAETQKKIIAKCADPFYLVNYRISTRAQLPDNPSNIDVRKTRQRARSTLIMLSNAAKVLNALHENRFQRSPIRYGKSIERMVNERRFRAPFKASIQELATMWHPPTLMTLPNTAQVLSKKTPPPRNLPTMEGDPQISFIGRTNYRDKHLNFGIRRFDRRRHLYALGKSGNGKSSLLELLVRNDIEQGYGCAVLDPHGDLIDDVIRFVPRNRIKDVVIFDPSDLAHPPSFNPMIPTKADQKMRVTLGFIDTFKKVLDSEWSDKMDYVLRYALIALLDVPGSSVVSLRRILSDDSFRAEIIRNAKDDAVKRFWKVEFPARREELETGPISQLLNKLDELLATDMVRNILGQTTNAFDFREFMDSRKIVLCKVSKGVLGAENASLLGSLIIWKIYEAAMSRADQEITERQDFYFYIDEFQNFATESFGEILSESRKYRLCMTFANQFLGQLPSGATDTVFGNVANLISFRLGSEDGAAVANELKPLISAENLLNLGLREFYAKISVDGEVQDSFSGRTLDIVKPRIDEAFIKECIAHSRKHYALPLDKAEEQLALSEIMSHRAFAG